MPRVLSFLLPTLALLLLTLQPASGKSQLEPENRIGGAESSLAMALWGESLSSLDVIREEPPEGYDIASDVRDGPNVYAYVRQNPWTSFDPEGLSSWWEWHWSDTGIFGKAWTIISSPAHVGYNTGVVITESVQKIYEIHDRDMRQFDMVRNGQMDDMQHESTRVDNTLQAVPPALTLALAAPGTTANLMVPETSGLEAIESTAIRTGSKAEEAFAGLRTRVSSTDKFTGKALESRMPLSRDLADGEYIFVVDKNGKAWVLPAEQRGVKHNSMVGAKEEVRAAGEMTKTGNKIDANARSGHFYGDDPLLGNETKTFERGVRKTIKDSGLSPGEISSDHHN